MRGRAKRHSGPQVLLLEEKGKAQVSGAASQHSVTLESVKQSE